MIQFIPFSKHSLHSFNLLSFFIFRVILRKIRIWIIVPAKLSLFLKYGFSRDPSGLFLGPCNIILNMGSHKLSDNAICRRQVLELPDYEQYIYRKKFTRALSIKSGFILIFPLFFCFADLSFHPVDFNNDGS